MFVCWVCWVVVVSFIPPTPVEGWKRQKTAAVAEPALSWGKEWLVQKNALVLDCIFSAFQIEAQAALALPPSSWRSRNNVVNRKDEGIQCSSSGPDTLILP
eukprot:13909924-Ditylum_brightwellii.AAC.1